MTKGQCEDKGWPTKTGEHPKQQCCQICMWVFSSFRELSDANSQLCLIHEPARSESVQTLEKWLSEFGMFYKPNRCLNMSRPNRKTFFFIISVILVFSERIINKIVRLIAWIKADVHFLLVILFKFPFGFFFLSVCVKHVIGISGFGKLSQMAVLPFHSITIGTVLACSTLHNLCSLCVPWCISFCGCFALFGAMMCAAY